MSLYRCGRAARMSIRPPFDLLTTTAQYRTNPRDLQFEGIMHGVVCYFFVEIAMGEDVVQSNGKAIGLFGAGIVMLWLVDLVGKFHEPPANPRTGDLRTCEPTVHPPTHHLPPPTPQRPNAPPPNISAQISSSCDARTVSRGVSGFSVCLVGYDHFRKFTKTFSISISP